MRNSKIIIVILICLLVGTLFYFLQSKKTTEGIGFTKSNIQKENQFEEQVIETGIINEMGKNLYANGYLFSLEWGVLTKSKVGVVIILRDKKISEDTETNVKKIINEFLLASNVDPILFEIEVANISQLNYLCAPE